MRVVVRIGGSVVASPPNPEIMSKYASLLKELKEQGHELVVVVGGGSVARDFITVARDMGLSEFDQDEVAIRVSRLFAQLLAMKLGDLGPGSVPTSVDEAVQELKRGKIVVMGGIKPGMTTDTVAAMVAERVEAELLVKATDQNGIYTKDPRRYADAEKIGILSFDDLVQLFEENKHRAGIHQVVDPEAVRILQKERTKTVVVNGFKPENILLAVKGEKVGTLIE
ncbi:MAG: UMP kinase [Candidatus Bathyarchaeota archaeon]|nr:MAG: UMP kinase [Candidatus Bathyarchaeota archaeon]